MGNHAHLISRNGIGTGRCIIRGHVWIWTTDVEWWGRSSVLLFLPAGEQRLLYWFHRAPNGQAAGGGRWGGRDEGEGEGKSGLKRCGVVLPQVWLTVCWRLGLRRWRGDP